MSGFLSSRYVQTAIFQNEVSIFLEFQSRLAQFLEKKNKFHVSFGPEISNYCWKWHYFLWGKIGTFFVIL